MHFILDNSLCDLDYSRDATLHTLENIIRSGIEGFHLISSSRDTLNSLSNVSQLGSRYSSYLKHLHNNTTFSASINDFIDKYIVIDAKTDVPLINTSTNIWHIPFKKFSSSILCSPTVLLCENLTDCSILEYSALHYKSFKKVQSVLVNCNKRAGGGSTTYQSLQEIINAQNEFCLCINDSDKTFPESAYGDTHNKCLEIYGDQIWNVYLSATSSRELENEIPIKFIEEAYRSNPAVSDEINKLFKSTSNSDRKIWPYLDLKYGFTLGSWFKLIISSPETASWLVQEDDVTSIAKNDCSNVCIKNQKCNKQNSHCETSIYPKISSNLSQVVLEWLKNNSLHKSKELVDPTIDENWLLLGKLVLEFCCAQKPHRL